MQYNCAPWWSSKLIDLCLHICLSQDMHARPRDICKFSLTLFAIKVFFIRRHDQRVVESCNSQQRQQTYSCGYEDVLTIKTITKCSPNSSMWMEICILPDLLQSSTEVTSICICKTAWQSMLAFVIPFNSIYTGLHTTELSCGTLQKLKWGDQTSEMTIRDISWNFPWAPGISQFLPSISLK